MWKKNLEDTKLKKGRPLLVEARTVYFGLMKKFGDGVPNMTGSKAVRDMFGEIGMVGRRYFLVAKRYSYGDIVSVHHSIWARAKRDRMKIIMYVQTSGYFYTFDPGKIKETQINRRGIVEMINFSIREGVNIVKLAEIRAIGAMKVEKNVKYAEKTRSLFSKKGRADN